MAENTGQSVYWDLPNYAGELFTADMVNTPFLTMIGGLTGGGMQTQNFEFPTSSLYTFPTESQPDISETASLTAPTGTAAIRTQVSNVAQIFHEGVSLSYEALSNMARLSGINTVGSKNNVQDLLNSTIKYNLQIIARDIEETILNGTYELATGEGSSNRSRGMMEAAAAGSTTDASTAALSKALIDALLLKMFTAGAMFVNPVIWVNGFQKTALSNIYGYAPEDRNVGGVNIKQIETDFGNIGIAPAHRMMDNDSLLITEMSVIAPVFQPVPKKGNFFYEDLSKLGASENGQIYGKFGLDHGPCFAHGSITGLATS